MKSIISHCVRQKADSDNNQCYSLKYCGSRGSCLCCTLCPGR